MPPFPAGADSGQPAVQSTVAQQKQGGRSSAHLRPREPSSTVAPLLQEESPVAQEITEIIVSTDVEADGPIPGPHSMLSLASAAYLPDHTLHDTFSVNLQPLPDAGTDRRTMQWWAQFPEAWAACRKDAIDPARAMADYFAWLQALPGRPIFLG